MGSNFFQTTKALALQFSILPNQSVLNQVLPPAQICDSKLDPSKKTFAPGPGAYQPKNNISPRGEYFISNFKSSMCRTFSNANRQSHTKSQSLKGVGIVDCVYSLSN